MPQYIYTAVNASGKEQKGKIVAATQEEATEILKKQQLFITSLKDADAKKRTAAKKGKGGMSNISIGTPVIKKKELVVLTRQLATLLDAGLPLIRSLRTLERQAKNPLVQKVLGATADTVESGSTFAEALAKHPKSFDKLYLNMIRAGEASGAMEVILNRLATFMEKASKIAGKVKSALIYPAVVLSIAGLVTAGLMIFIVPNFKKIFAELLGPGEEMPGITMFVLKVSDLLKNDGWVFLVGIAVIVILYKLINANKYGKWGVDWVKYNMPLFGPLISRTAISRFARTLGTLMSSGVPVLNALIIVRDTAGNEVVSSAIQKVHDAVKEGDGIAVPLGATGIFPAMVISMVEVGEETGKLPEMLDKIANTYDEEVDNAVGALTSMIEPLMIVGLAVIVGTIVIALFLPLTKIIEKLG
ncbi:MAG: type II secretion system F family protein [Lentisphaeria bacterium]|nr:type II secretion system F family protein [Lentisphaeria bacterium]MBQ7392936.1 type II secretion system F family protein [Lentisphaeria bacterium]